MSRTYADLDMRMKKTNQFISWGLILVISLYIINIISTPGIYLKNALWLEIAIIVLLFFIAIANLVISYLIIIPIRHSTLTIISNTLISYMICDIFSANVFVPYLVFCPITAFVMYYNKKYIRYPAAFAFVFGLCTKIFDIINVSKNNNDINTYITAIFFILCFSITAFVISILSEKYNTDIFGTLEDDKISEQQQMDVLSTIFNSVTTETNNISSQLHELENSSDRIVESFKEILEGTKVTCSSVEQQNSMTLNIRDLIDTTASKAANITEITNNVQVSVLNGTKCSSNLTELSDKIDYANEKVTAAMSELCERTNAMQSVIDTIIAISNNTTLLSLNASIEAARAGDAGKGFSVVADQIRLLSDQTKNSIENIRAIINELESGADTASNAITTSIKATKKQTEYINEIDSQFSSIDNQMFELGSQVKEINDTVSQLVDANHVIIDSITQLSSISEEVTASASEVLGDAKRTKDNVERAMNAVNAVVTTAAAVNN